MQFTEKPVILRKTHLKNLLVCFSESSQSYKIVEHLALNKFSSIDDIKNASSANNPHQLIRSAINPRLFHLGYRIACEKKPQGFVWSIYKMEVLRDAG